jgi:EF hand
MNNKIKMAAMTFALGLSAWSMVAQDAGGPPPDSDGPPPGQGTGASDGSGGGRHHCPLPPVIAALDTNHDGVIDASEIANASAALMTLDKNGDGKLTMEELLGPPPPDRLGANGPGEGSGKHHPPAPPIFAALDANHDGVIDASEVANASAALLTLDKNGDGKLTMAELMGPPHRGPHGPGGPDGQGNSEGPDPDGQNGPSGPDGGQPPPAPPGDS